MADYDIGYGKPPLSGLFRVGVSGNAIQRWTIVQAAVALRQAQKICPTA